MTANLGEFERVGCTFTNDYVLDVRGRVIAEIKEGCAVMLPAEYGYMPKFRVKAAKQ